MTPDLPDLTGTRLAVTGASGFCGSHLARSAAAAGADVVGLSRRPGPVGTHRRWDAATERPDLTGVDAVVHVAAAVGDPAPGTEDQAFRAVNVDAGRRLLDAADVVGGVPVVWVSSASVYDPRLDRSHVTEDHPTASGHLNAYGSTKAAGDRLALSAGAVVLRPRAVFGPGDTQLLPRLLRTVRRDHAVVPGPDVTLSITHVETLTSACLHGLRWPATAYNIADPTPVCRDTMLRLVLGAALHRPVGVRHVPVPLALAAARAACALARRTGGEPLATPYAVDLVSRDCVLDISRALATGWQPRDGIRGYAATLTAGRMGP